MAPELPSDVAEVLMKLRVTLFVLAAALASAAAFAQVREGTVEISPFAGYLFGGEFARGTTSVFDFRVDVDDDATYGLRLGYNITDSFEIEAQASHTATQFVTGDNELFGNGSDNLGDLDIDYFMGYMTFNFGHRRAVPYVTVAARSEYTGIERAAGHAFHGKSRRRSEGVRESALRTALRREGIRHIARQQPATG
jgi:opacity protein-like surface antigen